MLTDGDCVVCGGRKARPFHAEPPHAVVKCITCGHVYTFPRPEQSQVDEIYSTAGGWIAEDQERAAGADPRYSFFVALLKGTCPQPASLLDVGCSTGRFLRMAKAEGYECYGVEPGADAERALQALGSDRIFRRLYTEPTGPPADIITMFEVLEHVPDPRLFLRAAAKQLKPGGYLLLSVPNQRFACLKTWPRRRLGIQNLGVPLILDAGNHLHYFSVSGLRRTLNDVGLHVVANGPVPPDHNYLANRHSAMLKRIWGVIANIGAFTGGEPLSSNIWVLCSKPAV